MDADTLPRCPGLPPRPTLAAMPAGSLRATMIILACILVGGAAGLLLGVVGARTGTEFWMSVAVSVAIPGAIALTAVRGGMSWRDALSWAVPSWLLLVLAFTYLPQPASLLAFLLGLGLPLLISSSPQVQTLWFRLVLRRTNRGR